MLLPNATQAVVEQRKVVDYLLNPAHPDNGGKAAFFAAYGFAPAEWEAFATAVRDLAARTDVTEQIQSGWGAKFVIDGPLIAPVGTTPPVRTIWILDAGLPAPRLVTAYPRKE